MTGLGLPDVVVVLVIALLFLGPKRLPEAGRAVGHGIREFKESLSGGPDKAEVHELEGTTTHTAPVVATPVATAPTTSGESE